MVPRPLRLGPAVLLMLALPACGGGGTFAPSQHGTLSAARTTPATFTIHWTNASAPASVRHKDTISPSAQSVTVTINGTLATIANRTTSPTQSIALQAPVGTDQFIFNVYDGPNAQGHLLGSATVSQLIVDGAANTVTAVIQALCAVTNVQYGNDDGGLIHTVYGTSGIYMSTLQSVVLAGQGAATLVVGPEDVDGNVIIAGTGGTVSYQITGSATVTPVDGAHIKLTPTSGFRSTTPDTLTLAAPTCPSTTVAVEHSPAIYVENTSNYVYVDDWYGDEIGGGALASGDVLIGYDTHSHSMMTYNAGTGQVNAYAPNLNSHAALTTIATGLTACWSNYLDAVFGVQSVYDGGGLYTLTAYTYANPASPVNLGFIFATSPQTSAACSTFSRVPYAFFGYNAGIYGFSLATNLPIAGYSTTTVVSMATDDRNYALYAFNSSTNYVAQFNETTLSTSNTANYGFAVAPAIGSSDTDGDNVYAILTNTAFDASSYQGTAYPGFGLGVGTGLAIAVLSTNEN